ncbi:ABC transporter ATP-binding protein [uncultured Enterococcus sp.]|uniref:ABC transporter ATP-binding protein n=1 Tax=uncultured Enterococcus sp. TaxID=167972 RepID=UPI0025FE0772|nr:ABC transporter ATP-binding protein [uncultured Enterococcus sp.]
MNAINVQNISKFYQQKPAIQDVSFTVKEGEVFGFIGPNGAGKSTTIKTMLDFIQPDQGTVEIFAMDHHQKAKEIRQCTSYVSSDVRFYSNLTSLQIMRVVANSYQLSKIEQEKQFAYYIKLFSMDVTKKMNQLSLGNKKKLALACGLLTTPRLLILDEPTNGLDPLMQHRFYEELTRHRQNGMTIFLSSHDLTEIKRQADRAAFIKEGKIVTIEEINQEQEGMIISITGDHLPIDAFKRINAKVLEQDQHTVRLWYNGKREPLFSLLVQKEIRQFTITEPELEDRFLTLYEDKEERG